MNLHLFMAAFWMLFGLGLVIYHALNPQEQFLRIRATDWSPGWLVMILAVWNIVRWWGTRAEAKDRRFEEDVAFHRQRRRHGEEPREDVPNPEFDFNRPPLPKDESAPKPPPASEEKST